MYKDPLYKIFCVTSQVYRHIFQIPEMTFAPCRCPQRILNSLHLYQIKLAVAERFLFLNIKSKFNDIIFVSAQIIEFLSYDIFKTSRYEGISQKKSRSPGVTSKTRKMLILRAKTVCTIF